MAKKRFAYDYPRPAVTVDVVVVTREASPRVLLIRRKNEPYAGCWALPGGFVEMDESLDAAAARELAEETGVVVPKLTQLGAYGDPGRDPRGRTIAVAYLAEVAPGTVAQAGDDAAETEWRSLRRLPPLAFDHAEILADAKRVLKARHA